MQVQKSGDVLWNQGETSPEQEPPDHCCQLNSCHHMQIKF